MTSSSPKAGDLSSHRQDLPSYQEATSTESEQSVSAQERTATIDEMPESRRSLEDQRRGQKLRKVPPPVPVKRTMSLPVSPPQEQRAAPRENLETGSRSIEPNGSKTTNDAKYAILLMGATGAGKSSFIAAATGLPVKIGYSLDPCTRDLDEFTMVCADGTKIALIDTPGFNDLHMSDMEVLQSIVDYTASKSQKVIAALYLHKIVDKKITGSAIINLRMLKAVFGEHFFQNIALVTSMWSTISQEGQADADAREVELNHSAGFWADMIRKGAQYYRWDERMTNYTSTARRIVEMCKSNSLRKDAALPGLLILLELEKGVVVEETSAGQILTEELRKRQEKERKALAEEEEERQALEQEQRELEARLRATKADIHRDAEIAAARAHRSHGGLSRMLGGRPDVVVVSERRTPSSRTGESDRYNRDGRRSRLRDSRARADNDDDDYEEEHRYGRSHMWRRHTDRASDRPGWLRSLGI